MILASSSAVAFEDNIHDITGHCLVIFIRDPVLNTFIKLIGTNMSAPLLTVQKRVTWISVERLFLIWSQRAKCDDIDGRGMFIM